MVPLAAALLVALSTPAAAGRQWCATDPILTFANGTQAQWVAQFDPIYEKTLTGPVTFWIEVPSNIGVVTVSFPASTTPETVTVSYSGGKWDGKVTTAITVHATVVVPATQKFPTSASVRGNVRRALDQNGQSNGQIKLASAVDPTQWYPLLDAAAIVTIVRVTGTTTFTGP